MIKTRKNWTIEEQQGFLETYCAKRRNGMGKQAAKIEAMRMWVPEERHYSVLSIVTRAAFTPFIRNNIDLIDLDNIGPSQMAWEPTRKIEPIGEKAKANVAVQEKTVESIMAELIGKIREEVMKDNERLIKEVVDSNFQYILEYITDPAKRSADDGPITMDEIIKRKKIVIVGLLPQQFEIIKKEFPKMRLVNIESNQTGSKLAAACAQSETVLIMTDWVSHAAENIVRKNAVNWIRVQGTMSSLRRRLGEI